MLLVSERPRVDHPVDRPELYEPRGSQATGTNGQQLDHFYRSSLIGGWWVVGGGLLKTTSNQQHTIHNQQLTKNCGSATNVAALIFLVILEPPITCVGNHAGDLGWWLHPRGHTRSHPEHGR